MAKTLKEYFGKYIPTPEESLILESAVATRSKIDKENRIIEVHADFKCIVPKETLYRLESAVSKAYTLSFCKILPHYPSVLFEYDYVPQVLLEAERIGAVARGFFENYTYTLEGNKLKISIPFSASGIGLLVSAETPKIIENII